tara:strand:- start:262 stop:1131 length:870 start_codon:yes stop_codon:yes gene_type:complete
MIRPTAQRRRSAVAALVGLSCVAGAAAAGSAQPPPPVLPLTGATFAQALSDYPLLFVLFFSDERVRGTHLLQNYSLAAAELERDHQLVKVKLAWLEVRWNDAERVALSRRYGVSELPDIKIFHHGRPSNFEAAASTSNLVDIARWNAGHQQQRDLQTKGTSRVVEIEGNWGLMNAFEREHVLLIAFTNRWCTRCLLLQPEFEEAAMHLADADPPITLATVNIDDPKNLPLIERFGVLSFPVGKIFYHGRFRGDFMGGTSSDEIAAEMIAQRDQLLTAGGEADARQKQEL